MRIERVGASSGCQNQPLFQPTEGEAESQARRSSAAPPLGARDLGDDAPRADRGAPGRTIDTR
jgi:hypothetical protein